MLLIGFSFPESSFLGAVMNVKFSDVLSRQEVTQKTRRPIYVESVFVIKI
jgi:hypothetical protein